MLYSEIHKAIIRVLFGETKAHHTGPDWSDWYDSWYAALNVCEIVANQLRTDIDMIDLQCVSADKLCHYLQTFHSVEWKHQKCSIGWADGIKDCVTLIQKLKSQTTPPSDDISLRVLREELDKLRRYPAVHKRR